MGSIKVPTLSKSKRHLVNRPNKIGKPMPPNKSKRLKVDSLIADKRDRLELMDDLYFME